MLEGALVNFIIYAQEEIQKKFGKKVAYAKDCSVLSEEIAAVTNRHVSITTLKRFFGIIKSPFNPSKFTLDTLAIYLEFNNWQEFINNFEQEKHVFSKEGSWEQLKKRARLVTDYSLASMTSKIGSQITECPLRQFAIQKVDAFFNSSQPATAFIAPEGYGKTLLLTQLVERYFLGEKSLNANDIVCLIDGRILVKLLSLNVKINRIYNLLEFDPKNSFSNYFRENPQEVKGQFVLFVDGINEIFSQAQQLNHFVENLLKIVASYENISWFKLIITCHPDTWQIFRYFFNKNPYLKTLWFDVPFEGTKLENINIPLLESHEIATALLQNNFSLGLENIKFHYPEILDIICYPYFLHLFLNTGNTDLIHTDIELLYQYVQDKIMGNPLAEEKLRMIDRFFKVCDNGKTSTSVDKSKLTLKPENELAYKELISEGTWHEYKVPGSYLSIRTFVEFSHAILLEFFLANRWLKGNKLTINLLKSIIQFYDDNLQLQINVLTYIIKIAFKEEKTSVLKDIYTIFLDPSGNGTYLPSFVSYQEIITVIGIELRKNKKVRAELIPWYAKSKIGQSLYFENFFDMDCLVLHTGDNLDYYLKYNQSAKAQVYGRFMKFMQYFLALDQIKCEEEYTKFMRLKQTDDKFATRSGLCYSLQIIYQTVFLKKMLPGLMGEIFRNAKDLLENGNQNTNSIPQFEITIIFALNYGNCFKEIIHLSEYIIRNYELDRFSTSVNYQLFRAIYARALLNTGETKKAMSIFNQVIFQNVPVNIRQYMTLRFNLIKVEFLLVTNQTNEVRKLLNEIKSVAHMLRFFYFYQKAEEFEQFC
ncbi:hypothetical protein DMA11_06570 [Marinilabiliaceae bacterium JC017]|nr:hypothetical protein DMA11_06570 [Marinilabiliaceae bacterium JC017]